ELLAGIWSEVLRLPRPHDIDAEADFFALGGHSLRAAQVVARIRDTLGPELPLRALFEAPTVAALAARIEAARRAAPVLPVPEIVRRPRAEHTLELPLSFAQQRLWFLEQMEPASARYHIPAALWLDGELDRAALRRAGAEIVRRHEVLRTTYRARDGRPVQVIQPLPQGGSAVPGPVVVELAGLAPEEREAEARRLLAREAVRPFALAAEPPLRSALIRLDARRHALGLVFHHIAADGWSMGVVMRELRALYEAFRQGRRSPLAEPAIQYADFACWQRETLRGEVLEAQLAYWLERLAGARPLELPTDRPRPAVRSPRGAVHSFLLPAELPAALRRVGRAHGATLFMTLLAAFQGLLYRLTGQTDLAVGIPVANRDQARIEELIG
ncbi:MAG: non-ribosomal peptide synthetase, partial [Deltaproteobacteria bacterium]|nr:non-ribosomal peptide synthetase [Deltaproteobacteria bacterium]